MPCRSSYWIGLVIFVGVGFVCVEAGCAQPGWRGGGGHIGGHSTPGHSGHSSGGHFDINNYIPHGPILDHDWGDNYYPNHDYYPSHDPKPDPIPDNTLPNESQQPGKPPENEIVQEPDKNNVLEHLNMQVITPEQAEAFTKELTDHNNKAGQHLKDVLGDEHADAVDKLVEHANDGSLKADHMKALLGKIGSGLNHDQQLAATKHIKELIFGHGALKALRAVNFNVNVVLVINVNVNVGIWGGFWGFPGWGWPGPFWLNPWAWWGPAPYPYYCRCCNWADAAQVPYSFADPVPESSGRVIRSGILLKNGGPSVVNYSLDGKRFSMQPGFEQHLDRKSVTVAFGRGGQFGNAKYKITEGTYKFTVTDKGWELYKHSYSSTLDNSDNPFDFRFLLNNQKHSIAAKQQKQYPGMKYPPVLRFDDGQGNSKQKVLEEKVYKIALAKDGTIDLFKPGDVKLPVPIAERAKKQHEETKNLFATPEKIPSLFGEDVAPTPSTPPSEKPAAPTPRLFGDGEKPS